MPDTTFYEPDNLIVGGFMTLTRRVTVIVPEGGLKRGSVLGKVTASGKYKLCEKAADDGSNAPIAILVSDTEKTAGDNEALVFTTGMFSANHVTLGTGMTLEDTREALHTRSIFLEESI